jgi:hypothetical protein
VPASKLLWMARFTPRFCQKFAPGSRQNRLPAQLHHIMTRRDSKTLVGQIVKEMELSTISPQAQPSFGRISAAKTS